MPFWMFFHPVVMDCAISFQRGSFVYANSLSVVKTCGEASVDEEKFYRNCNKQVVHTVNSATIFSFPFQKWKY
jgi:hypothetical protein